MRDTVAHTRDEETHIEETSCAMLAIERYSRHAPRYGKLVLVSLYLTYVRDSKHKEENKRLVKVISR